MSLVRRPRNWLWIAVCAAAFGITTRVMVSAAPMPLVAPAGESAAVPGWPTEREIRDPALEDLIGRFARAARAASR